MPTDDELDAMAVRLYGPTGHLWSNATKRMEQVAMTYANLSQEHKKETLIIAIAAKHATAACSLAEDSANYMARIVM